MPPVEAVSAPRLSATSNTIDVTNRLSRLVTDDVAAMGYSIARNPMSYAIAAVHALLKRDGTWTGAADPGHDGMAVVAVAPIAMLFLRCKGGVSHHPDESVRADDVAAALDAYEAAVLALAAGR